MAYLRSDFMPYNINPYPIKYLKYIVHACDIDFRALVSALHPYEARYEYRGPGPDSDKAAKNKKKRKKDKHSDDEPDAAPLLADRPPDQEPPPDTVKEEDKEEIPIAPSTDKLSESESENSQRSSTDRDFEIVEADDVEDPKDVTT